MKATIAQLGNPASRVHFSDLELGDWFLCKGFITMLIMKTGVDSAVYHNGSACVIVPNQAVTRIKVHIQYELI